ncbi:MAG TPA: hypothetical protein VM390_00270 [Acidimicrobiales bacterium]|nr:hypothetical protein [Acidimicrobiales bacterium]
MGYVIAAVVITIVVVLVAIILSLARRIGVQADQITSALDEARINTLPLWDVDKINGGVRSILKSAQEARAMLGGGQ